MKKLKMSILAFAVFASISSAFAFSSKANKNLNTYYATQTPSGWTWGTSVPPHLSCKTSPFAVSCEVQAASKPADNTMPAGQPINNQAYQP